MYLSLESNYFAGGTAGFVRVLIKEGNERMIVISQKKTFYAIQKVSMTILTAGNIAQLYTLSTHVCFQSDR